MIDALLSLVKPIDAPGSIQFFLLCAAIGAFVAYVWPRNRRFARRWMTGLSAIYLVLALPVTARMIAGTLPTTLTVAPSSAGPLDALFLFDGDNRKGRVSAAAQVFAVSRPEVVWVVGGQPDWISDNLPEAGVPARVVRLDRRPLNTRDQIAWVARRQAAEPGKRVAIISSRLQTPRIAGMLRAAGLTVPLINSPIDTEPPVNGWTEIVPMYIALRVSRDGLYEHMALAYYRYNGWVRP